MQIIDGKTVVVSTSEEFETALSEDNGYVYIYLDSDITLEKGFVINSNKKIVVIDGTYNNVKHTYTNYLTELINVITVSETNEKILVKNIDIVSSHSFGVISVPASLLYSQVYVEYNNVGFNGIELSYNDYGVTRIVDSNIQVKETNSIAAQRVCDCNKIEIGGKTSINSAASTSTVFLYKDRWGYLKFLPDSRVTINTNNEIITGTNKIDFTISHGAEVNLVTGNGFAAITTHGVRDVMIEENANFTFIEKSHQRVPMWNVYGNFTVNEGASVYILNTYSSTPSDNYNIYFKGTNQKITIDNPKKFSIYTKNANVLYTNNPVEFSLKFNRINMWTEASDFENAFTIYDLPILYWYKEKYLAQVTGVIDKTTTTITSNNFTADELSMLPDLSNFSFQSKKVLTIGRTKVNIHPITSASTTISGHTAELTDVKIVYGGIEEVVRTDVDGLFEYNIQTAIADGTEIKFISCLDGAYDTRSITTPYDGELTLMSVTPNVVFDLNPMPDAPNLLQKIDSQIITIVDSRRISTAWKLYAYITNPLQSNSGKVLDNALTFRKFDNTLVTLKTEQLLVYEAEGGTEGVSVSKITFSKERGLMVNLDNITLDTSEEYSTKVVWSIEI